MTKLSDYHKHPPKPNIIIILADDLGFSDVGCFGSEILTPNIDALAYGGEKSNTGIRFTQMYNCARCCPSRAALLTGMYPHQAGIGHMVYDAGVGPAYQGFLREEIPTVAELLRDCGGYKTYMAGKWHVGGEYPPDASHEWIQSNMGDASHPTPTQRGFDQFYGTLGGGGSYYQPPSLVLNDEVVKEVTPEGFYYTDAINDEACKMIKNACTDKDAPFFLYVAHCAPHWPLHAPKEKIEKYKGKYMRGWDSLRRERHQRMIDQKLISPDWSCSPRDDYSPPWDEDHVPDQEWEDSRMATYAAQITVMDEGIGRIIKTLHTTGSYEDTVIFFLSDNGGCAEYLKENGEEGHWPEFYGGLTRDGRIIKVGNRRELTPGDEETFMSYDLPWANASNSPFRLFKSWVHEGGIATPFVIHWPAARTLVSNDSIDEINHDPWIIMDIVATCYDLAGIHIPDSLEGESFLPILLGQTLKRRQPLFWEHQGNCAVRDGKWKLVYRRRDEVETGWELYDMEKDRTELQNLATHNKEKVKSLIQMWKDWATRCDVLPWPLHPIKDGERDWSNLPWMW
ncbi:hypothetical protein HJC23_006233 [Cyclotella cryptica]|uniref:Sulfatase N-terminal domain-containing protein n=1 Tax=Cyclotella cryptica TaxID=29204 RepID=A0ABD3PYN0_9STRA